MTVPLRILQLIPAKGWYGRISDDGTITGNRVVSEAITCFALVEDLNASEPALKHRVEPMWWGEFSMEFCIETSNFIDIVRMSDKEARAELLLNQT